MCTLSDLFLFPRHWTVVHCHKHGCWNRCWLRHRETLRYSLHYCMSWCQHLKCANLHCGGKGGREMERKTWWKSDWINEAGKADKAELKRRGGGTIISLCNSLSKTLSHTFSPLYLHLFHTDWYSEAWWCAGWVSRHISVLIKYGITAQYWCIVQKGTHTQR